MAYAEEMDQVMWELSAAGEGAKSDCTSPDRTEYTAGHLCERGSSVRSPPLPPPPILVASRWSATWGAGGCGITRDVLVMGEDPREA
jgi:hypothetical protein